MTARLETEPWSVERMPDLTGTTIIITGANSGIGLEAARLFAHHGAHVVLAVRDERRGRDAAATVEGSTEVRHLDLADLASVRSFAENWRGDIHVLVNNAGVLIPPFGKTRDGFELQFGINHLGHFALTTGLHDALASASDGARIVSVSSTGHLSSPVHFDDLHFERRAYDPWQGYGQSKTANVLLAVEATRRWADDGIVANALMPGGIMTNLQRYVTQEVKDGWQRMQDEGRAVFKTTQQGAATSLVAAVAPELATGGHYLEDCNEAETVADDAQVSAGVRAWALDPGHAERLWDVSLRLVDA